MACIIKEKITKKRTMLLSGAASGSVLAIYLVSTVTTMPAFLSTAACPAMCVEMCGVFFLVNHLSGKNRKENQMLERKDVENI